MCLCIRLAWFHNASRGSGWLGFCHLVLDMEFLPLLPCIPISCLIDYISSPPDASSLGMMMMQRENVAATFLHLYQPHHFLFVHPKALIKYPINTRGFLKGAQSGKMSAVLRVLRLNQVTLCVGKWHDIFFPVQLVKWQKRPWCRKWNVREKVTRVVLLDETRGSVQLSGPASSITQ